MKAIQMIQMLFIRFRHLKNRIWAKSKAILYEKTHDAFGATVKYMFFGKQDNETLVVSFPACAPNAARYNYAGALSPYRCDKLFLLDDFGANHQGCYLVEDSVEKNVLSLIVNYTEKSGKQYNHIYFIGSSKGGYSALNFSFLVPNAIPIIGAPQYFLGNFLSKPNLSANLKFIIGEDITEEKIESLNNRLRCRILNSCIQPEEVFIHYSNQEPTFNKHIKYMLEDLHKAGVSLKEDVAAYKTHDELGDQYSLYLKHTLDTLLKS